MTHRTRTLVATVAVLAALTGCSADGSADGMTDPAAADDVAALSAEGGQAVVGDDTAQDTEGEDGQQVVQTAHATMTAPDPVAAARQVVVLATRLEGRVDARYEYSGAGEDEPGSASLTLRIPSRSMADLPEDLGKIGEVREFQVATENVTNAAEDLDARITATELSVERMSGLLGRASTTSEIIEAESALTDRQANLERLRSERARLADRVALSTVDVEIYAPERAPEPVEEGPKTFLDGLETGWTAFTAAVRGFLVVVGVLLPWLVLGALVAAVVVVTRRRRRAALTTTSPTGTTSPPPADPATVSPAASPAASPSAPSGGSPAGPSGNA
ncbi:DUF4349 domain-containing protein [Cellulomonas xiejunii]|uniref:DUF4349 domain-containing protein n=1 Tax=Cellulomonas xiejunii TaxID=2968083 RepID=A0ABY5KL65_9CELL|nr:DUF4349 domain-containing protein [Cellulomonas xiejunii]MCC2320271.1 DUF4349 domain-containing protein [Cellulomonas xiejunii]UUI70575.1 DUF4349 domain-containing protein [Cellulomonas xiejunii]